MASASRLSQARSGLAHPWVPDGADGADVDLSLIPRPAGARFFPALLDPDQPLDLSRPRNPRNFSKEFARLAEVIGFGRIRFHDLREVHSTSLLDLGIPVHRVAERLDDDLQFF